MIRIDLINCSAVNIHPYSRLKHGSEHQNCDV